MPPGVERRESANKGSELQPTKSYSSGLQKAGKVFYFFMWAGIGVGAGFCLAHGINWKKWTVTNLDLTIGGSVLGVAFAFASGGGGYMIHLHVKSKKKEVEEPASADQPGEAEQAAEGEEVQDEDPNVITPEEQKEIERAAKAEKKQARKERRAARKAEEQQTAARLKAERKAAKKKTKADLVAVVKVQAIARGMIERRRLREQHKQQVEAIMREDATPNIQRVVRGFIARRRVAKIRKLELTLMLERANAEMLQRELVANTRELAATTLQRAFRRYRGRVQQRKIKAAEELAARQSRPGADLFTAFSHNFPDVYNDFKAMASYLQKEAATDVQQRQFYEAWFTLAKETGVPLNETHVKALFELKRKALALKVIEHIQMGASKLMTLLQSLDGAEKKAFLTALWSKSRVVAMIAKGKELKAEVSEMMNAAMKKPKRAAPEEEARLQLRREMLSIVDETIIELAKEHANYEITELKPVFGRKGKRFRIVPSRSEKN